MESISNNKPISQLVKIVVITDATCCKGLTEDIRMCYHLCSLIVVVE